MEHNQLNINSFIFELVRIPILKFSVQSVDLPDITLPPVNQPSPLININQVGDHLEHSDFSFTFLVDEKMENYRAIYYWMRGLAFPNKFSEFEEFVKGITPTPSILSFSDNERMNQYSDIILTVLSNHKNPIFKYRLLDAFPISLSGIPMNVTSETTEPIQATCGMKFTGFEIESA